MFDQRTTALIRTGNEAKTEDGKWNQLLQCAMIDAYTTATGELSRFITSLYKSKNPNASIIHNALKPLCEKQDKNYDDMVKLLNNIEFMDSVEEEQ